MLTLTKMTNEDRSPEIRTEYLQEQNEAVDNETPDKNAPNKKAPSEKDRKGPSLPEVHRTPI